MPQFMLAGTEDPMSTLCRMVVETKYEDLPGQVVAFAKRHILDTLGVAIGGSGWEGVPEVVEFVKEQGGKADSFIPIYGGKVPASMAGFAIGTMARALDMCDSHEEALHSAEYTLPPLLAALGLKKKASGKECITAFVVGQEMLIRIGIAYRVVSSRGLNIGYQGGHYIFGGVASTAKLLNLNLNQLENAEGIVRGMTQPHDMAMYYPATLMVRVHHGFVAQNAINACLLARKGITGPRQEVLVGPKGFLTQFSRWETRPEALTERLGEEWKMLETCLKPYASCKCTHTAVDGIIRQMAEHNFTAEDIAAIQIDASPHSWAVTCQPYELKWDPHTVYDCQFSLPYAVATAAYDKRLTIDSYLPEARARQKVRNLMRRITVTAKDDLSDLTMGARVTCILRNGRTYSGEYLYPKGHPNTPFSDQDYIDKFKVCASYSAYKLNDAVISSLIETLFNLEKVDNVEEALIRPITPA